MTELETDDIPVVITIEIRKVKGRFDTYYLEKNISVRRGEIGIEFRGTENIDKLTEKSYEEKLNEIRKILEVYRISELDTTRLELLKEAVIKIVDLIYADLELKEFGLRRG